MTLLITEKMTRLAVYNSFTSLHLTEMMADKLRTIPDSIRVEHSIFPSMVLGLCKHTLITLKEQIIDWMIAKIIKYPSDHICA